jgi:hypothetical protein
MIQMIKMLAGLLLAGFLAACGGGGGSPGTTTTGGGGNNGGGSGSGGSTATPTVALSVVNSSGASVNSLSIGASYAARALVKDAAGAAVSGKLVTFSASNTSLVSLAPTTALTDSNGVAQVVIAPASVTALGATTLSASATVGAASYTGQTDISVSSSSLSLSPLSVGSASLPSGGNTSLSVVASIGGSPAAGTPVNVTFSTSCGRINNTASNFSTTTDGSGTASAVFSAVNADGTLCSGPVTLTASSAGSTPKTATVTVASAVANAITFVSATPAQIYVAGSGALEQSLVRFKVLSGSTPLANVGVRFSLLANPLGVGLGSTGSTADVNATTDSNGEATVSVFSGTVPGPVKVRATLTADSNVFAETQNLSVSSGPPSQKFMSLSVETFNIEGWAVDGTATKLTVRLADRQGNPVEDGTVVNFTAEGGQVASSCATQKVNGISGCSVDFISQNPRPSGGRVSVLAFTSGTKDYVDANGNNRFDAGDTLINIGDPFRDDNENGVYDFGEFVVSRGGAGACTGSGWPFPARANTCDGSLATTVRQQAVILYSSTSPKITMLSRSAISGVTFSLASYDNDLLPMPAGTKVTAEAGDATPTNGKSCAVDKIFGTTVANIPPVADPNVSLATPHQITVINCDAGDSISIKITSPSGLETTSVYMLQ